MAAIDFVTKWWAVTALSDGARQFPGPVDLQLHYNTGTALGLFTDLPPIVISVATVLFIAVVANMWRSDRAPGAPVVLIVAGGLANVVDRVQGGGVARRVSTGPASQRHGPSSTRQTACTQSQARHRWGQVSSRG